MTDLLCKVWNPDIFENESKFNKYLASLCNPNDKRIY